jgi:hypothetical protein
VQRRGQEKPALLTSEKPADCLASTSEKPTDCLASTSSQRGLTSILEQPEGAGSQRLEAKPLDISTTDAGQSNADGHVSESDKQFLVDNLDQATTDALIALYNKTCFNPKDTSLYSQVVPFPVISDRALRKHIHGVRRGLPLQLSISFVLMFHRKSAESSRLNSRLLRMQVASLKPPYPSLEARSGEAPVTAAIKSLGIHKEMLRLSISISPYARKTKTP